MATIKYVAVTDRNYRIGQDHHRARYTDREVAQILALRDSGMSSYRIAKLLDIPRETVRDYVSGRLRAHVPDRWRRCPESVRESRKPEKSNT